jgi:hypothetical protein
MSVYYDVKNVSALDNALDFPDDVKADDGRGGTNAEKTARGRKRKLDYINGQALPRVPVDVRLSSDGSRAIIEAESADLLKIPDGLILAGPMTLTECLSYLLSETVWSK